jgi:hypothetical protein
MAGFMASWLVPVLLGIAGVVFTAIGFALRRARRA